MRIDGDSGCERLATLAAELTQKIRLAGYKCDSIYHVVNMTFSLGFRVRCNNLRYTYEIEDRGGNWEVTLD